MIIAVGACPFFSCLCDRRDPPARCTHQLGQPQLSWPASLPGAVELPVSAYLHYRSVSAWRRSRIDRGTLQIALSEPTGVERRKDAWPTVHDDDRRILNAQLFCRTAVVRLRACAVACEHVWVGDQPGSRADATSQRSATATAGQGVHQATPARASRQPKKKWRLQCMICSARAMRDQCGG